MTEREKQNLAADTLTLERRRKTAKTSKTSEYCIYRFVCILYAALFFAFGPLLIISGYISYEDSRTYVLAHISDTVSTSSFLLIAVGVSAILIPFVGLYSMIRQSAQLVKVFAGMATFFIVALSLIACYIFLSRNQEINLDEFENNLYKAGVSKPSGTYIENLNNIQKELLCCGLNGPESFDTILNFKCTTDSMKSSCTLPKSCCIEKVECDGFKKTFRTILIEQKKLKKDNRFKDKKWLEFLGENHIKQIGCKKPINQRMDEFLFNMGILVVVICLINIIGMFFVTMVIMKMGDRKHLFNTNKDRSATAML